MKTLLDSNTLLHERVVATKQSNLFCRYAGEGSPVIVIHGGPGLSQDLFLPHLAYLATRYFVVFYDQRGSGNSSGYPYEATTKLSQWVDDLETIRREFGFETVNLLGFSFGGLVAMAYAAAYSSRLRSLLLLDSMPCREADGANFGAVLRSRTPPDEQTTMDSLRQSSELAQGSGAVLNKWLRLRFRAYFFDEAKFSLLKISFSDTQAANYVKIADLLGQEISGYDLSSGLSKISVPTLILQGDYDPIQPSAMIGTQAAIPSAKLEVVCNAGHFSYVEQPDVVANRLLSFFGELV